MKTLPVIAALSATLLFVACKKDNATTSNTATNSVEGIRFSAVKWDATECFSTTDTSFRAHTWSASQLTPAQMKNVDLLYIHDYDYDEPGFMDPFTASQEWYWNNDIYYHPEYATAMRTMLYVTGLTKEDFDLVKGRKASFDKYFKDTILVRPAPHEIFPVGTCVGGRGGYSHFKQGLVFGFKDNASGKRGFIYLRNDQDNGWPDFALTEFSTIVDIVKEK